MDKSGKPLYVLSVCLALAVSACAVPYARTMSLYQAAPLCCESMGEFPFQRIETGGSMSFDLDEKSPAYPFSTGKSFFKALELPEARPSRVVVRSYMLGDSVDSAYILFPQVLVLDRGYRVVQESDPRAFRLKKAGFIETTRETWGLMYKLEAEIPLTGEGRYLVVMTTEELLRARTSLSTWRTVPVIFPGIVGAVPVGKEEVLIPHSPFGRINVSVPDAEGRR